MYGPRVVTRQLLVCMAVWLLFILVSSVQTKILLYRVSLAWKVFSSCNYHTKQKDFPIGKSFILLMFWRATVDAIAIFIRVGTVHV